MDKYHIKNIIVYEHTNLDYFIKYIYNVKILFLNLYKIFQILYTRFV